MKKTFSPNRLQSIENSEEEIKKMHMEINLMKLNLDAKCDNRVIEKIN
jgi:hypothetical protein